MRRWILLFAFLLLFAVTGVGLGAPSASTPMRLAAQTKRQTPNVTMYWGLQYGGPEYVNQTLVWNGKTWAESAGHGTLMARGDDIYLDLPKGEVLAEARVYYGTIATPTWHSYPWNGITPLPMAAWIPAPNGDSYQLRFSSVFAYVYDPRLSTPPRVAK